MHGARLNTTCETTVSVPEDSDEPQEVIEVQILPQVREYQGWGGYFTPNYESVRFDNTLGIVKKKKKKKESKKKNLRINRYRRKETSKRKQKMRK